jgi:hypothetical protein
MPVPRSRDRDVLSETSSRTLPRAGGVGRLSLHTVPQRLPLFQTFQPRGRQSTPVLPAGAAPLPYAAHAGQSSARNKQQGGSSMTAVIAAPACAGRLRVSRILSAVSVLFAAAFLAAGAAAQGTTEARQSQAGSGGAALTNPRWPLCPLPSGRRRSWPSGRWC